MDIMEMTRELGKALQADDRYIAYNLAKQVNDNDAELQQQINDFDRMRNELNAELCKEDKDTDKIKELDESIKSTYKKIMSNKNMVVFSAAQGALEALVAHEPKDVERLVSFMYNGK